MTKTISGGNYVASNVSITSGGITGTTATITGDTIKVVVPNEKITGNYKLQIEKVDSSDNTVKLQGGKFTVKVNSGAESSELTTGTNGTVNSRNDKYRINGNRYNRSKRNCCPNRI